MHQQLTGLRWSLPACLCPHGRDCDFPTCARDIALFPAIMFPLESQDRSHYIR